MSELALMLPTEDNFLNEFRNEVAVSMLYKMLLLWYVQFIIIRHNYNKGRGS
jgi:hypothetical protein